MRAVLPSPSSLSTQALGQKGDSPAPISPLSPLHSPDSLEELSLTESPNQPPPPGSFPPGAPSKDMPWEGEEGEDGKAKEDLLDSLGGPYLSLGRDPGPRSACEDSGVSFSPEEKPVSSDRSPLNPQRKDPESHPQTKDPESNPQTKVPESHPQTKVPDSHPASSNPTELWDSPLLSSQDNSKLPMESFPKETSSLSSPRYDADLRGSQSEEEEDDLMREVKKNNNPFDGFSPLADSGYSHFGEPQPDSRASKMSDSPTPDLVQYGESQESFPTSLDLGKPFDSGKMAADSLVQSMAQFTAGLKGEEDEEEEDALPPSLPDILKSSPLNPDKMDSGSSEGSPEEQSPIFERKMMESPNPPINLSANNPFAFDAKVSLLKEMTELMEGRKGDDDQTFGAFDLLKEAEETSKGEKETSPAKGKGEEPVQIGQKDWFSCQDPPKKPEPLDLKTEGSAPAAEDSDSESPTADSLSPVLEAMAKNPSIFQVETEKKDLEKEVEVEPEEVSEHEVSSEEFEFIERPPRGVIDEFLEALDTSKFASSKPPEIPLDEEPPRAGEEAPGQSSYRLLAQGPPLKGQPEDLQAQGPPLKGQPEDLLAQGPPLKGQPEDLQVKQPPAQPGPAAGGHLKMPSVSMRAVLELLYWREARASAAALGAGLLVLLSLSVCSIVSVLAYVGLALLSVTIAYRVYRGVLQAVQKTGEGHPFRQYLDQDLALPEDLVQVYGDLVLARLNRTVGELRRLFLVEDLVDSIKFAVFMWILTYVGALFNGLTLLILGLIGVFSCPIIYEKHQAQIDHYVSLVSNQVKDVVGKVQAKVPGMKPKAE